MIFRRLYRRRLFRLLEPYLDASGMILLERTAAETSEWKALKSFLPMRWFYSQDEVVDALLEVRRLAVHYSREPDSKPWG